MALSRRSFRILLLAVVVAFVCMVPMLWSRWRVHQLESRIIEMQRLQHHDQVVPAALKLITLSKSERRFIVAGIESAKVLRNPTATARLIQELDIGQRENSEWYADLVELFFGPECDPHAGAEICRVLIAVNPGDATARQRLLFYYAMLLDHPRLLGVVEDFARAGNAPPEAFVYYVLSDSLRLTNAAPTCQRWLAGQAGDERIQVALAIHIARNLDGTVPSVSEEEVAALRSSRQQSQSVIASLLDQFPQNQPLLAYALETAIDGSDPRVVADLLIRAPDSCDHDNRFWRARGWLAARDSDWDKALAAYDRALELYPVDWKGRYYRAETLRQLERLDEAEAEYQLSREGRALERELIQQPTVRDIPPDLLARLNEHFVLCGQNELAERLLQSAASHD